MPKVVDTTFSARVRVRDLRGRTLTGRCAQRRDMNPSLDAVVTELPGSLKLDVGWPVGRFIMLCYCLCVLIREKVGINKKRVGRWTTCDGKLLAQGV